MNPHVIPDGLTLFYTLTAPLGSHAAGSVVALCEWHAFANMRQANVASLPDLPGHDTCVLCAEEDAELTAPFGLSDAND